MKRIVLMAVIGFFLCSGMANASLTLIGTASYDGDGNGTPETYNLIHMDDGPFGPITWLDYTRSGDIWQDQVNWASGLSFAEADIQLNPGYTTSVDWSTGWRLPSSGDNPLEGFNVTTSEMGYLYYVALGNVAYDGPGVGLQNGGDFNNLLAIDYWSGTEYSPDPFGAGLAWKFLFRYGYQEYGSKDGGDGGYALAVRPGDVSAVPVPSTVLLLGSGLAGLGAFRRGQRRRH